MATAFSEFKSRHAGMRAQFEKASVPKLPAMQGSTSPMHISEYGRSRKYSEAYGHFKSWVYACSSFIARKVASQPFMAGEVIGATDNPESNRSLSGPRRPRFVKDFDLPTSIQRKSIRGDIEPIESHPVLDVLDRPNPIQRKFEFLVMSSLNLLITGEAYWIIGNSEGTLEMWAIPTSWITPVHVGEPFSSYQFQPAGASTPVPLKKENVVRTYLPDPSDPKSAMSPLHSIIPSVRIDASLQKTQMMMFERGINPNLLITVGKVRGPDGKMSDRRPVLTGPQRRQIIRSVRETWGTTVNYGDPAVIDGLIESVHKLQATPAEMDFMASGTIVKERIFQAYHLNDLVLGGKEGNRAQVVQAQKNACDNAINPIVDAFTCSATTSIGPLYDQPARLVIYIEPCKPIDPELQLEQWKVASENDYVTETEFRTNILNLAPRDDDDDRTVLLNKPQVIQAVMAVALAVANGDIEREQAVNIFVSVLRISEDMAEAIAGDKIDKPEPVVVLPAPVPASPPADEQPSPNPPTPPPTEEDESKGYDAVLREFKAAIMQTLVEFEESQKDMLAKALIEKG